MPRIIKVIESHIKRGAGLSKGEIKYRGGLSEYELLVDDFVRSVIQYHTLDGKFLAEVDPRTERILADFNYEEENNK